MREGRSRLVGSRRSRRGAGGRRGVALLLTMWVLVLLSFAGLEMRVFSRADGGSTLALRERMETYYLARGGVERGLALLAEYYRLYPPSPLAAKQLADRGPTGPQPPLMGYLSARGLVRLPLGTGTYTLRFDDLSGRVNVNRVDPDMLVNLLQVVGLDRSRAEELSDSILDWIDADDLHRARGAEGEYYVRQGRPTPRNAPIYQLRELLLIKGMTADIFYGERSDGTGRLKGLVRFLTTEGAGKINVNTAPAEVLLAIPGMDAAAISRILAERELRHLGGIGDVFGGAAPERMAASPLLGILTFQATEMRVEGTGELPGGGFRSRVSAMVGVLPAGLIIRNWQDDIPGGLPLAPGAALPEEETMHASPGT
jgi:type II secretory pathway component PulK